VRRFADPLLGSIRRPGSRAISALAACVAALVVAVHTAALLHFAVIAHGVCAEHGHVVHAEDAASELESQAPRAPQAGVTLLQDEPGHAHCLTPATLQTAFVLEAPVWVELDDRAPACAGFGSDPSTAIAGVELLSLAPKQSPPV